MGWFLSERGMGTNRKSVPDLLKVPELMWIDKWHLFGPLTLIAAMYLLGEFRLIGRSFLDPPWRPARKRAVSSTEPPTESPPPELVTHPVRGRKEAIAMRESKERRFSIKVKTVKSA